MNVTAVVRQNSSRHEQRRVLGIDFFAGTAEQSVRQGLRSRLIVAPSAPGLVDIPTDADYREALEHADLVLTDSGFMVLLWWLFLGEKLERISGLRYLKLLLKQRELRKPGAVLWVMPSIAAQERNLAWLRAHDFKCDEADCYVAPFYPAANITDPKLVTLIQTRHPRHVVVCIGGGPQEKLGLHLARTCSGPLSVHCIGAAMGFLSGNQVRIPDWADRWFLGWAFRCLTDPRRILPRYLKAIRLAGLLRHNRHLSPLPV